MSTLQQFDNAHAMSEGWALFNDGEIQRLDEPSGFHTSDEPVFASDKDAIAFVRRQAQQGSPYHKAAWLLAGLDRSEIL